jgi:hypothetical protein
MVGGAGVRCHPWTGDPMNGYFPLPGCTTDPREEELAALYRRRHALELRIADNLAAAKATLELPPVLVGWHSHGASMRQWFGAIVTAVFPFRRA